MLSVSCFGWIHDLLVLAPGLKINLIISYSVNDSVHTNPDLIRKNICVSSEYIAMYTYESSEQGDLTFQQGDVITVLKKEGDWWTGTVGGKTGVFPSNYVKPKDAEVRLSTIPKALLNTVAHH